MHLLYETPAGYSLFKLNNSKKYSKTDADDIQSTFFKDSAKASKSLELVQFQPFQDTADAVAAISASQEGKLHSSLESFLKQVKKTELAVADKNLAKSLKESTTLDSLQLVHDDKTKEVFRGIREYLENFLESDISTEDLKSMQLGLSHSLSRYKLKFSADKVDTMIVQAIGLLDELDKEINNYAMRVKEWYGWHFPELQGIVSDNVQYAKIVVQTGHRHLFRDTDLSAIFEESEATDTASAVLEAAELSMGTELTDADVLHIQSLAEQVLSLTEYRSQLSEYLKNRMNAMAPNLTVLVGELVGARLIAHSGSLMNLAKQPASTLQILGAEKALFRALKTKHDTPKYGLIYHASLIGQAAPKFKGKISRVLAAKAALAVRVDALTETEIDTTVGFEGRAKVEARLRSLETGQPERISGLTVQKTSRYNPVAAKTDEKDAYNVASDMQIDTSTPKNGNDDDKKEKKSKKKKKRKDDEDEDGDSPAAKRAKTDDEGGKSTEKKKKKKEKKSKKDKKKD